MKDLIIAGASTPGSAKLVDDINLHSPTWNLIGYVDDDSEKWGADFFGYPVLGGISLLQDPEYQEAYTVCFIYGGTISTRIRVVTRMSTMGVRFATLVHPSVSTKRVEIGEDCVIQEGCFLNYGTVIGDHCIISPGTSVGHEVVLEENVFCATRVTIPGRVTLKRNATVGAGAVLNGSITVGESSMVGLGAVVFRNVPDRCTVVGNPARVVLRDSVRGRRAL